MARNPAFRLSCAVFLWLLFPLAGCGPRDQTYSPSNFQLNGPIVPADIAMPPGARPDAEIDGIYVGDSQQLFCCLIAPHAHFLVRKYGTARSLCVGVYLPKQGPFLRRGQRLSVWLDNDPQPLRFDDLREGFDDRCTPIPLYVQQAKGEVAMRLRSAIDFVPAKWHAGADTRHYGLVLLGIYFR